VHNAIIELMSRRLPAGRIRYEDLVASPVAEMSRLLKAAGFDVAPGAFDFIEGRTIRLTPNHTVMGNPMRMETGEIQVRADDEWRQKLPSSSRMLVTALTLPFLLRYGYSIGSAAPNHQPASQNGLSQQP
jgi:hypothetical protein